MMATVVIEIKECTVVRIQDAMKMIIIEVDMMMITTEVVMVNEADIVIEVGMVVTITVMSVTIAAEGRILGMMNIDNLIQIIEEEVEQMAHI